MLNAGTLTHGGIMLNYQCNAACRHCLYSCSPTRNPGYVSEDSMEKICRLLSKGGCCSVHIGGGEPFLDFEGLLMAVRKLRQAGIKLEYIETNAFWAAEAEDKQEVLLKRLMAEGASCLCISLDPFHAEHVPYGAPVALAQLCETTGMDYFLWKGDFLSSLSMLDANKTHSRSELEKNISEKYIHNTAMVYGIEYGGRAVNIEKEYATFFPVENFTGGSAPCKRLLSTMHFHVDMNCNFIPPRCTGIIIPLSEVVDGIPDEKYPAFNALYSGGVSALLNLAAENGFSPVKSGYSSACNLCFHLRHFLSEKDSEVKKFSELDKNHYEEALRYYS